MSDPGPARTARDQTGQKAPEFSLERAPQPSLGPSGRAPQVSLLLLQSQAGNRALGDLLQAAGGEPPTLRRKCASCAAGAEPCASCREEDELLQRQALEGGPATQGGPSPSQQGGLPDSAQAALSSPAGAPLDNAARSFMEERFQHDFSRVRVHTGEAAARAAESLNAAAFTVGSSIWFGRQRYRPGSPGGLRLLAHELSHTIQQRGRVPAAQASLLVGGLSDPAERAADRAADEALSGGVVSGLGAVRPMLRRQPLVPSLSSPEAQAAIQRAIPQVRRTEDPNIVNVEYQGETYRVVRRVVRVDKKVEKVETSDPARLSADFDASNAWLQVEWCTVGSRSTLTNVRLGANIPAALRQAVQNLVRGGQNQLDALRNLDVTPFVEVEIARSGQVRVTGRAQTTVQAGTGDVRQAGGSLGVDFPGGRVAGQVDVAPGQGPGGRTGVSGQVTLTIELGKRPKQVRCQDSYFERSIPVYAYECTRLIPEQQQTHTQTRSLYFEYASETVAARGRSADRRRQAENERGAALNDQEIPRIQELIDQGWQVSEIKGYTSPEGPREPRREGGFSNNELARKRSAAARDYIQSLCNPNGALTMRQRTCIIPNAPVEGVGELLSAEGPGGEELEGTPLIREVAPEFLQSEEEASRRTPELEQQIAEVTPRQQASLIYPLLRRAEITFTRQETIPAREEALGACPPDIEREVRTFFEAQETRRR
jgi:hypothetical protein